VGTAHISAIAQHEHLNGLVGHLKRVSECLKKVKGRAQLGGQRQQDVGHVILATGTRLEVAMGAAAF